MKILISALLFAGALFGQAAPVSNYTVLVTCASDYDRIHWWQVKDCPAVDGPTLTKIINIHGENMDSTAHCGEWGQWIMDKQSNIMGRYKNPSCPGEPSDGTYGKPDPPRSLDSLSLERNGHSGNWYWKSKD